MSLICVYILVLVLFIGIGIYFAKMRKKADQIYKLNESLNVKNNDLKKMKHDYGAQISYLYGLCLMNRFEDLKKSLKDIINTNEATTTAVTVAKDENSFLYLVMKPAMDFGIHVVIEENCDLYRVKMNDLELYRVIGNVVDSTIKILGGKGIIIAKTYEYSGDIIIKIENNGPKIPEHRLNNIFKVGFTTKWNEEKCPINGLVIANELIEKNNGKMYIKSNDKVTEFKIVLPMLCIGNNAHSNK